MGRGGPRGFFKSEARDHFNKKVRKESFNDARQRRDAETRRMEQYRQLCKKEGIQSKRLEEWDEQREESRKGLETQLHAVMEDTTVPNAQRKEKIWKLKRNFAAYGNKALRKSKDDGKSQPNNAGRTKTHGAISKVNDIIETRRLEKEEQQREIEHRLEEKERKISQRKKVNSSYSRKTKKGQPVMSGRMEVLLDKVKKSAGM